MPGTFCVVGPLHRVQQRDDPDHDDRGDEHALDHGLVVALADEPPQPLVLAERPEHHQGEHGHPGDRVGQEMAVALVGAVEVTLEAQPEGEEVCERDQQTIDHQLGQRVTMDGEGRGSDPSAHAARILVAGV